VNDAEAARSPRPFRALTYVLAVVAAVLAFALGRALSGKEPPPQPAAAIAAVPDAAPAPAPSPARSQLVIHDLRRDLEKIRGDETHSDGSLVLFESVFGGVKLTWLGPRQRMPLHFRRVAHEALLPVLGEVEVARTTAPDSPAKRITLKPSATTVLYHAPYCAYGWANPSETDSVAVLTFTSSTRDTSTYVELDDDRLALGAKEQTLDLGGQLAALKTSAQPSRLERLAFMGDRLAALAVAGEAVLEALPYPTIAFVVSGRGHIAGPEGELVLEAGHLAILGERASAKIRAEADAPLSLLLFQPARDDATAILKQEKKLYSQFNEELVIRDFFRDRRGGFFLDVGAADYQRMSTTYYLDERLGWSGIGVDALPEHAPGWREHRPRSVFLNYLVTDKPRGMQKFYRSPAYLELSSASKKVAQDQARDLVGADRVEEIEIPSITLDELLRAQKVEKLDFLSMDIEDHEPQALAGFSLERFRPELVCIEAHRSVADAIYRYFLARGYERIEKYLPYDSQNWYFTPRRPAH
jgi:FkbM family methyltransferase